jgi:hypothetical protein
MRLYGLSKRIAASVLAPTANDVQFDLSAEMPSAMRTRSRNGPMPSTEKPKSFGSWLISTVSAMPFM